MKKVLILSYYWPPTGGSAVQRWLRFSKYMHEFGWKPIVYTPENPDAPLEDKTLLNHIGEHVEIVKYPIWEPYQLYRKFVGMKKEEKVALGLMSEEKKEGFAKKVSRWIRGNFFIPDARKFWIKPSVKFLKKYLNDHPVDAIVSTGPPHSLHLIAEKVSKSFGIPWVADFRDPWTTMDYYHDMYISKTADRKHHCLERMVLNEANTVVVIGNSMKVEFAEKTNKPIEVITNGFDEESVASLPEGELNEKFLLVHVGSLMKRRNPDVLWEAIAELVKSDELFAKDLEVVLPGKVDIVARESIKKNGIEKYVRTPGFITHNEAILTQKKARVLLLLIDNLPNAEFVLSGKIFEYLGAARPILCIGPTYGDAAKVLDETKAGIVIDYKDKEGAMAALKKLYEDYKNKTAFEANDVMKYSRKNLAKDYCKILDNLVG